MWGPRLMQFRACRSCICFCIRRLQGYVSRDSGLLCCCCRLQMFRLRLCLDKLCLGIIMETRWLI